MTAHSEKTTMHCVRRVERVAAAAALALSIAGGAAAEDRLTAAGDTLRGRVVEIGADGVVFELVQGEGQIRVPWEDVEGLETEDVFTVLHGERGETSGRLLGVDADGFLLVGDTDTVVHRIDPQTLFTGYDEDLTELSLYERLKSRYRFWSGSFDLGGLYVDSDTDQTAFTAGFRVERKKEPTRFLLEAAYRFAADDGRGQERNVTENIAWGFVRGERDITERFFAFASTRATYDEDKHLSLRLEPRIGLGVRIVKRERFNLSGDIGAAWVYENYWGSTPVFEGQPLPKDRRGTDDYFTVAFGLEADAELAYGVVWRAKGEYLPAVDDWERDYLLRGETSLEFPLLEWLAFKVAMADEYDNTPPKDTTRNRFTTTAALSLRF